MIALQQAKRKSAPFFLTAKPRAKIRGILGATGIRAGEQIVEHYRAPERGLGDVARAGVESLANP